jgi:hypothetical protein
MASPFFARTPSPFARWPSSRSKLRLAFFFLSAVAPLRSLDLLFLAFTGSGKPILVGRVAFFAERIAALTLLLSVAVSSSRASFRRLALRVRPSSLPRLGWICSLPERCEAAAENVPSPHLPRTWPSPPYSQGIHSRIVPCSKLVDHYNQ